MIVDILKDPIPTTQAFDVCIVGAGAAGIALTVELAAKGLRVALLEGGGDRFEVRSQALYAGQSEGLAFNGLYNGRCRMLGGTTALWGGQILELDAHIFPARPWIPGGHWPIGKADLSAAYARALELEGLGGAPHDPAHVWQLLRLAPPNLGDDLDTIFSRWCPVLNFARLHHEALRSDPNVHVFLHANFCALTFQADGETVRALSATSLGRVKLQFVARHFVFSVGGIETSRLLLQPEISSTPPPWKTSGLIGRNFQDHISCYVATVEDRSLDAARHFDYLAAGGFKHHAKIRLRPQTQQRLGTLDVCGTIAVTTDGRDDLERAYETYRLWKTRQVQSITPRRVGHFILNAHRLLWHKLPYPRLGVPCAGTRTLRLTIHCEQSPLSAGQITLAGERDALGLLQARVAWLANPLELHSVRQFLKVVRQAFEERGLGRVLPDAGIEEEDASLVAAFRESYHHIGGARMGSNANDGVVDRNLLVFGTRNLYICSSAVFPSAGYVNPTHTVVALAVRLAGHLAAAPKS